MRKFVFLLLLVCSYAGAQDIRVSVHIDDEEKQVRRVEERTLSAPKIIHAIHADKPLQLKDTEVTMDIRAEDTYLYIANLTGRIEWVKTEDRSSYQYAEVKLTDMKMIKEN